LGGGALMRATAFALLTLLLVPPALPQCDFTPVFSDQFRSSILDLAVEGNDLWAATSYGISLYDRSVDPPRLLASVAVPGSTRFVRAGSGVVYAGSGNSIAVVRKSGRGLQLIRTVDAGAPVNDLVLTTLVLFVATRNGIAQYSLADPTNPSSPLQITQTAATSMALDGSTLYASGGDTNVVVFSISTIVQPTGTIVAPANVTAVHANNGKLFVSTALQTSVFVAATNAGSVPFSVTSMAAITGDVVFVGGTDRTLRAIDFTTPGTPIEIFRDDLAPSSGTVNRVTAVATTGGRAYAGGGDIGIVDYDITSFSAPFPLRGTALANGSSVVSLGDNFYVGLPNGVTEFSQTLTKKRSWDAGRSDVVRDGSNGFLLTSSGNSLTLWALDTLGKVAEASFASAVSGAVLVDKTGYAILGDRTLWSVDFTQAVPVPQPIIPAGVQPVSIARSGNGIALADTRSDGTTAIAYFTSDGGIAKVATVPGLATTGVTLSDTTAAVQTFRGITLIDFGSLTANVLPQSNDVVARQLVFSGMTLVELTDTTLRVWNTQMQSMTGEVTLPASPIAVNLAPQSTIADVVTSSGVATVALDRLARMPTATAAPNGSAFYKKVIASPFRIGLVDPRGIDLYTTTMQYAGAIRAAGIVDVAASDSAIYTLSGNLNVTSWSPVGTQLATTSINEGADAQALSIVTVNGAVWVSIVRGCTTSSCQKKTIVYDRNLSQTGSLTGAVTDVVTNGNRGYAITDLPAELRVLDVTDPAHPSIIASRAAEGMSLAYWNGTIYVLGNGLASYSEASLTKIADLLTATSNPDEHIRIVGNCAIVTGRDSSPQLFTLPPFTPSTSFMTPSTSRMVVSQPGTFYVLTDHSLEIWSTAPLPKAPRRPPAR
jgi:hypothetical protein